MDATKKTVNIADLSRMAVIYNNVLRELPYFAYNEVAKALRLNIIKVDGEDVEISTRRRAGILRPYAPDLTLENQQEILKFFESKLKPELTYAELNDNITNYRDKKVVSNQGEMLNNKIKKHPLELLILKSMVLSYAEDVIFTMFFADRDKTVASPMTSYTGFYTKADLLVVAGEISEAKRNLRPTGAFDISGTPGVGSDGKNHYQRLVEFVKSAHPLLRKNGEVLLYAAENPITAARDGFRKIVNSFDYPSTEQVLEKLRSDANAPALQLVTHEALGTGDRLQLQKPGLMDFGVGDESDKDYVQVRNPYKDPNMVQFWIQSAFDTRIKDIHEKVFQTNDQENDALDLAGDYTSED
jgi:hypothetical protein